MVVPHHDSYGLCHSVIPDSVEGSAREKIEFKMFAFL